MLIMDGEHFRRPLRVRRPTPRNLSGEIFSRLGAQGRSIVRIGAAEALQQRHARLKAVVPAGEPNPIRRDVDPLVVEELLRRQCQCAAAGERGMRLFLTEEIICLQGQPRLAPSGLDRRFASGDFGKYVSRGARGFICFFKEYLLHLGHFIASFHAFLRKIRKRQNPEGFSPPIHLVTALIPVLQF